MIYTFIFYMHHGYCMNMKSLPDLKTHSYLDALGEGHEFKIPSKKYFLQITPKNEKLSNHGLIG